MISRLEKNGNLDALITLAIVIMGIGLFLSELLYLGHLFINAQTPADEQYISTAIHSAQKIHEAEPMKQCLLRRSTAASVSPANTDNLWYDASLLVYRSEVDACLADAQIKADIVTQQATIDPSAKHTLIK